MCRHMETFLVHLYYTQIPSSYQLILKISKILTEIAWKSVTGKSQKDLLNIHRSDVIL